MSQFKDDKMEYIENDIDKIKQKSGMYISYVGERGALHLGKEIIQNAIDECANPKSPAKNIVITLDLLEDSLSVEDDGRGIPEDDFEMDILCTKLNSGSKFTREQGGATSGENGVGLTATNALSEKFSWASYRGGNLHQIDFEQGVKVKDTKKGKQKKEHGCIVKFSPSKKYLGRTAKIPKKGLIDWVEGISYFIPNDCKITLNIVKGLEKISTQKYKRQSIESMLGMKLQINDPELCSSTLTFSGKKSIQEDYRGERKINRSLSVEFSFAYTDTIEPWIDSFCNYVNTTSGGVHLNAIKDSIQKYFTKKTTESMSEKEKEKYKIIKSDIESGLNLIVNLMTDAQMNFVGQTKTEIANDDLYDPIKEIAMENFDSYFSKNQNQLTKIVKIIKTNCKARIDASKIKAATIKETVNKFDKHTIKKFTACNNNGKEYKELHICEGDSAAGSLINGRDPDTQAILSFRGVTANGFKRDASTILDNEEWKLYVTLLKTNFGPKFDLSKCDYDKIIIETDSDIDGLTSSPSKISLIAGKMR